MGREDEWANGSNFGYPAGIRTDVPMSGDHLDHVAKTSWSLEQAKIPESTAASEGQPIGIDEAIARFDALGLAAGYAVALPGKPTGVYSGSVYPDDLGQQRVIDMSYADYGPLGKALEWGINVHLGQQYGLANQIVLLAACIGIVLLAVSAGVMWWKRRPKGSLGVPPLPQEKRVLRGLLVMLAIGGVIFPLVGASLLVMLVLDLIIQSRQKRRTI
jgi:uncharacterized iron-regulated membrane protein